MLYGCETWTASKIKKRKLDTLKCDDIGNYALSFIN